jgi:inosine-uridine nucleoside N-ribohydrolase
MQIKLSGERKIHRAYKAIFTLCLISIVSSCVELEEILYEDRNRKPVQLILDSDTNNELDDQHAIAYLLSNDRYFNLKGVTVNKTSFGGTIEDQAVEAERVLMLCARQDIAVFEGAAGDYQKIKEQIAAPEFDGSEAVDFIIETAKASNQKKLVILAVGKLTNIALALLKAPFIAPKLRIVWLGSHYPDSREYNLINDTLAVAAVLQSDVEFEIVTVREGKSSGTANVVVYTEEIKNKMQGQGPQVTNSVAGRNGKLFSNFGDYSVSLFELFPGAGSPQGRSFFDVAAVAILKKPYWAEKVEIPAPRLSEKGEWIEQPDNPRKIVYWENFEKNKIMQDFYRSMDEFAMQKIEANNSRL